jgi:hypothetical protein
MKAKYAIPNIATGSTTEKQILIILFIIIYDHLCQPREK